MQFPRLKKWAAARLDDTWRAAGFCMALLFVTLTLHSCASAPPKNVNNSCDIFYEKEDWYPSMKDSYKRWGVPIHVQLAIMHQESRFVHDAQPPRDTIFWIIPWFRSSSAFGYAQAQDSTWDWYRRDTGNRFADRDDFDDAVDFIGWYGSVSARKLGISKWDAYRQYLAYHEGHGGYQRKTYKKKPWLIKVAKKVDARARQYAGQLKQCEADLKDRGWWFWPF